MVSEERVRKTYSYIAFLAIFALGFMVYMRCGPTPYLVTFGILGAVALAALIVRGSEEVKKVLRIWGVVLFHLSLLGTGVGSIGWTVFFLSQKGIAVSIAGYFGLLGFTWLFFGLLKKIRSPKLQEILEGMLLASMPQVTDPLKVWISCTLVPLTIGLLWRYTWRIRFIGLLSVFAVVALSLMGATLGCRLLKPVGLARAGWWAGFIGSFAPISSMVIAAVDLQLMIRISDIISLY